MEEMMYDEKVDRIAAGYTDAATDPSREPVAADYVYQLDEYGIFFGFFQGKDPEELFQEGKQQRLYEGFETLEELLEHNRQGIGN